MFKPSILIPVILVIFLAGTRKAHAQLPSLPSFDSINASIQGGWITSDIPFLPDAAFDADSSDRGLWGLGVETELDLPINEDSLWAGTLGVGYNQLNLNGDLGAGRRMRGTLKDLPALSLYLGRKTSASYFGLTIAVSELSNGRIHTDPQPGTANPGPIKVSANAFSFGASYGYEYNHVFIEIGYMMRYFPSLAYELPAMSGFPNDLREKMYAGGFMIRVGGALGVKSKSPPLSKTTTKCAETTVDVENVAGYDFIPKCEGGVVTITPDRKAP